MPLRKMLNRARVFTLNQFFGTNSVFFFFIDQERVRILRFFFPSVNLTSLLTFGEIIHKIFEEKNWRKKKNP